MVRKKRRTFHHLMEDESYAIIKKHLPKEWVVRAFNSPDYGIDLVVELFEKIDENVAETLGEFIYIQVKSAKQIPVKKEKIYSVGNVAKGEWHEEKSEYIDLDVVKYSYDVNSIFTIHSLGGSVSVLLLFVDIASEDVYFINMNDYIDKLLIPQQSNYTKKQTITIKIPAFNNLKDKPIASLAFRLYGKRAKFLAAFSKFAYQKNELGYMLGFKTWPVKTYRQEFEKDITYTLRQIYKVVLLFINQIEDLEIWKFEGWAPLPEAKKNLLVLKSMLNNETVEWNVARDSIIINWHQLTNLNTMYEDLCREWFLPKMIGLLCSYPDPPIIVKAKRK